MKKFMSQEKGVTIITVTTMVIVMLIIISTLVFFARNSIQMEAFQGLKADISEIEAKALIYYTDTKAVPLTGLSDCIVYAPESGEAFPFGNIEFRNPNDSERYYKVDVDKLGITKAYDTDYYINEKTLTVYAQTPILMNGKYYGRYKEDFVKFNDTDTLDIPDWAREVPAEMYEYDDRNYIIGINTSYINDHLADNAYYSTSNNLKQLIIPAYNNGSPVAGIASGAFSDIYLNNGPIKIPFTVKIMESYIFGPNCNPTEIYCDANIVDIHAFANITNVPKITIGPNCQIPDGTQATGGVFSHCNNLQTIIIEGSSIGKYTFGKDCVTVRDIYFLGSPSVIPEGAFYNCGSNSGYLNIHTQANSNINEVKFPNSIVKFEPYCFMNSALLSVTFPNSTKEIGRGAFSNMPNRLENVIFNNGLQVIGDSAFSQDIKIKKVQTTTATDLVDGFGPNLKSIGAGAFKNTGLTTVNLYNDTTYASDSFPTTTTITHSN